MLKQFLVHSLFGRFLLIILLPNIIIQLFAVYMFYERHWSGVSKHMAVAFAGEIAMITKTVISLPIEERDKFLNIVNNTTYLKARFSDTKKIHKPQSNFKSNEVFNAELNKQLPLKYNVSYSKNHSEILVDIQFPNKTLRITSSKKRLSNPSTYIFIMWMTGTAVLFLLISIVFMRNQLRSISTLAVIAKKFGMGQDNENFKPSGALEVRQVAQAFIDMKERIKRQVEQRTEMLAGVSHDLKTPLTRLKLQLAMMSPSKEIKELQDDILEMEKMIQGYIDFAKGKERVIDASVNIADVLRSIIAGYREHHKKIELKTKKGVTIHINSNAFRRVITNILDNALRYGNKIEINTYTTDKNLILICDDDGPGIPVKKRELVFKPFYRIDSSRHIESGNTGLGLSISKDIIVGYGGDITLEDSPLGGLRVIIKLPLQ